MSDSTEYLQLPLAQFSELLASPAPVPGGGGAAAYCGALGAALVNMVAQLTLGKPKYADVQDEVKQILAESEELRQKLLAAVQADAEAFTPLSEAYALPAGTDEEKAAKAARLSVCSRAAAEVPLAAMEQALRGLVLARQIAQIGSRLVISDAGCGAALLLAAVKSFEFTVRINLGAIMDKQYVAVVEERLAEIMPQAAELEADARRIAAERLL